VLAAVETFAQTFAFADAHREPMTL
jgi:hypothetical protein